MGLKELTPRKALNKAFLKVKPNRIEIEHFKLNLIALLDSINHNETEEFHKNLISDFLKNTYYSPNHFINTKGRNDLVIHNANDAKSYVGVIIETKKPTNNSEMISKTNINAKALHEMLLYYLRERITHKNIELKHLIVTNINEWFIFDANLFERLFAQNKSLLKSFNDFEAGRASGNTTDFFYKQIAEPFIANISTEIEFAYFNIQDYQTPLRNDNKADDNKLIALFKLLSPEHLLKLPFINDSNSLDKNFYSELLHIIGLTETKDGSKKLIKRNKDSERNFATILEETIIQLNSLDKLSRIKKINQFGNTTQERLFNVALELSITWINRILFLKLLEAQLISYHKGDKSYSFLNIDRIKNYDDLNDLFFLVLARQHDDRNEDVKKAFDKVPYLNSSLFEPTELEQETLFISNLKDNKQIPIISSTVLKNEQGKKRTGTLNTLEYLFDFLNAYDFASEGSEEIQEENKTLINASVLGLIFEKINGYKDGSFFTPGFITMYMCRETIRKAIIQKFNEIKKWNCNSIEDLYNNIEDRKEANQIVNSIKICDPAVGSGHFLVSALNEIIALKSDLKILQDKDGKRLKEYHVEVINDELIITDEDGKLFEYHPNNKESQRIQETLFSEKQTIIENCLFGVDINANSVKICRLRLWIELLKNAYYKSDTELETLPNIDINIKCGNSLISRYPLDTDIKTLLKKSKWSIDSYRIAVNTYRNAENKEQKREMERLIDSIKSEFRSEISQNDPKVKKLNKLSGELFQLTNQQQLFEMNKKEKDEWNKKVKQLSEETQKLETEIEEIKNNKIFENAFEWRFEFPEVLNKEGDFIGFDIVIGNPPYIDNREIDRGVLAILKSFKTNEKSIRPNIYQYFIEQAYYLLKHKGQFCFINPNQFLSIDAGYGLRKFIIENTIIENIDDVSYIKVFEDAATYTTVWSFRKEKNGNYPISISKSKTLDEFGKCFLIVHKDDVIANGKYQIIANINQILINKIERNTIRLGDISQMVWGTSQSGYSKLKILKSEYDKLTEKEKTEFAKIIQTRDIKNFYIDWKQEYIKKEIFSDNVVKKFLLNEKIVIARMTLQLQAAIDNAKHYVGKSTVLTNIDPNMHINYILAMLNSNVIDFWYKNYFENTHLSGGYIRFDIPYLKKIPIPNIPKTQQKEIIKLTDLIINEKTKNPTTDTSNLQSQINQLVYKLYGLNEEEIKIIENYEH